MTTATTENPTPFVGRDVELSLLGRLLDETMSRQKPKLARIRGDHGIDKTTLINHFVAEATNQDPSLLVGRGQCIMEARDDGLAPAMQIFNELTAEGIGCSSTTCSRSPRTNSRGRKLLSILRVRSLYTTRSRIAIMLRECGVTTLRLCCDREKFSRSASCWQRPWPSLRTWICPKKSWLPGSGSKKPGKDKNWMPAWAGLTRPVPLHPLSPPRKRRSSLDAR